jgi:hypothetical protein
VAQEILPRTNRWYLPENRTMKLVEIILSRGKEMWKNNGEDETNLGTLKAYVEMSQ